MFKRGLFENPYVDVNRAMAVTGDSAHCAAGYRQQQASVVMLKNRADALPLRRVARIYVPHRHLPRHIDFWGDTVEARTWQPWTSAAGIADADAAVVFMASPMSEGLGYKDGKYVPISLQYRPYTASTARPVSLGRDSAEAVVNRSYRGRTAHAVNECDLDTLVAVRRAMGHRPVIVVMNMANPAVMAEVEPLADAILVGFNVQPSVYLDVIQGEARPSALLPFELPAAMEAIEAHCEDRPHDIAPYRDSEGNTYGFGFGMDFNGVISDWRTDKYVKPVSKPVR